MTEATAITPLTNTNRPCADILREMADVGDAEGNVILSAEFLDALADHVAELEAKIETLDVLYKSLAETRA